MTDKHKQDKQCSICLETLPMEAFYYSAPKRTYLAKCKTCTIEYNSHRRRSAPKARPRKMSLYELHTKLLSGLGPGIEFLQGRYVHTYKEFSLYLGPWGYVLDGELLYGEYNTYDIAHVLHTRHMKLMRRCESGTDLEIVLDKITLVRNSCGVPINVRFAKSLVLLDQYFLWMDKPRKLLISEAARQTSLSEDILEFILPTEKRASNPIISAPVILKNSDTKEPQVPNNTYDFTED